MKFLITFAVAPWVVKFRDMVSGTPQETAARALMPYSTQEELQSARSARAAIPRWQQAWLAESLDRRRDTARSYASRLRVAFSELEGG